MNETLLNIFQWIKDDYKAYPLRFFVEVLAWIISIGCALGLALTVPTPPLLILYPIWIVGCIMYAWAAYDRGSFGMVANYLLMTIIDSVGLIRML